MFNKKNIIIRKFRFSVVTIILLSVCMQTFAKQQDPNESEDMFEMSLEDLMDIEVETVYSASKYSQKVTEAPSSITIINSDEINNYGWRTLAEILRSVRGFFITNDSNYTYVGVRGFGRPGDYNSRVLILLDGYRINDNIYDMGYVGETFPLDVDLIDRVEIIRGPGSSLYGSSAFLGVINVISKSGSDLQGTELSGEIASHNTFKERASYGAKFKNDLEMLLSYTNFDSKGQSRYYKEFNTPANNNGVAENADGQKSHKFFGKFGYENWALETAYSYRQKRIPTASYGMVFNDNRSNTVDTSAFLDLKYKHDFEGLFDVTARAFYGKNEYDGKSVYSGPYTNYDYTRGEYLGTELQFVKDIDSHKVIWGLEYQDDIKQDQGNYDEYGIYLDDKRESERWGVFIQDEFILTERLTANIGVRHDNYSTFGETTNPRAALIFKQTEKSIWKFLYGKAFKAPTAYEMYYHDEGYSRVQAEGLTPETIETFEIALEQNLSKGLWATLSAFIYQIDDVISDVTVAPDKTQFQNAKSVKVRGVEFELDGKWENGWQTRFSYCYTETDDKQTNASLVNSPKQMIKANLTIPVIKEKLFAGIETQYFDERKTLGSNFSDAFILTNLTLTYKDVLKNMEVSVGVYNLFDDKYSTPGFSEHIQDTLQQDERSYRVKLTYRF